VVPTCYRQGAIEYVSGSVPLVDIEKLIGHFRTGALDVLIATAVGSYISAYVLGIRDRHHDNILVLLLHHTVCLFQKTYEMVGESEWISGSC